MYVDRLAMPLIFFTIFSLGTFIHNSNDKQNKAKEAAYLIKVFISRSLKN